MNKKKRVQTRKNFTYISLDVDAVDDNPSSAK